MQKEFNTEGWCNPQLHYMGDMSEKFRQVMRLIERGKYFTINRPHQYGKTTMLKLLDRSLKKSEEWLVFRVSFEGINKETFQNGLFFCRYFLELLELQMLESKRNDLVTFLKKEAQKIKLFKDLSKSITALANKADCKMILLIDEVDSSSNQEIFLKFLGVLRHKYLNRELTIERTFHSVILSGVHDIKTLKLKMRPLNSTTPYNSPWNIATDFKVDMNLQPQEIQPMLEEYAKDQQVQLDATSIAQRLFYLTSGYPFLVSGICKVFDEQLLPAQQSDANGKAPCTEDDIDQAAHLFLKNPYSNTNFDHLIKNLENYPELYQLVFDILIEKQHYDLNIHDPVIHLGILYGIFVGQANNEVKIHNRIYSELIFNYMTSKVKRQISMDGYENQGDYLLPNKRLNLQAVLDRFQRFMIEQQDAKDHQFLERNGRLLFLGFLQPILNGSGYVFKEAQISNEKRLDLVITFYQHQYIIELKIWRGAVAHEKGLVQLADYLERQHLDEGYLLIYDFRKLHQSQDKEWVVVNGKRIYAVWV